MVSVLLSASVERFSVSRMRDFKIIDLQLVQCSEKEIFSILEQLQVLICLNIGYKFLLLFREKKRVSAVCEVQDLNYWG